MQNNLRKVLRLKGLAETAPATSQSLPPAPFHFGGSSTHAESDMKRADDSRLCACVAANLFAALTRSAVGFQPMATTAGCHFERSEKYLQSPQIQVAVPSILANEENNKMKNTSLLLSIHPEFVEEMVKGTRKVEHRSKRPRVKMEISFLSTHLHRKKNLWADSWLTR